MTKTQQERIDTLDSTMDLILLLARLVPTGFDEKIISTLIDLRDLKEELKLEEVKSVIDED